MSAVPYAEIPARPVDDGPCDLTDHLFRAESCPRCHLVSDQLRTLEQLDPALVGAELRPILMGLLARRRACARCGRLHLQKRLHTGEAAYCRDSCRVAAHRERVTLSVQTA